MNEQIISENTEPTPEVEINTNQESNLKDKKNSRFKEGQPLSLVRVRFPGHAKSLPFLYGRLPIQYGQKVVAMSERGMAVGYINSFPYKTAYSENDHKDLKFIKKIASDEDISHEVEVYKQEKNFENICARLIEKHQLKMQLTHVEFTQFGKKVVFYFYAPERVDFRGLVKDLVSELKLRIELRQISIRDRAASIGSLGPCGRELCCSSFLSRYGHTHIRMAKNQNLSFSGGKINGVCSQPKCCLGYEEDVYTEKRTILPKEDHIIKTFDGEIGKVTRLHLIIDQFEMLTHKGKIKRYTASMYDTEVNDFDFPERFEHIEFDNRTIIGLEEDEQDQKDEKIKIEQSVRLEGKEKAKDIYDNLFADYNFFDLYKDHDSSEAQTDNPEQKNESSQPDRQTQPQAEDEVKIYFSDNSDSSSQQTDRSSSLQADKEKAERQKSDSSRGHNRGDKGKNQQRRRNSNNRNRYHSKNRKNGQNRNQRPKNNQQT